ncbi:hypothetical protein [Erythrobacter crassostreae]|uniref:Uncharacterized protein n=1 Tax=Erythrobacter crassostreae TaxID=2828328 RepID=A0A9X1JLK3_9SPHN|nr:hypothetical protein [Erythrobacter crassostrea]MBV7258429.1 hypothetical protein [Erythrobacter crassostrea]
MSSNAAPALRFSTLPICFIALLALSVPLAAQDQASATADAESGENIQEPPPAEQPLRLDLSVTVPKSESDQLLEEDCEEEADAARIANEIIVCRQLGEATDGSWNKEEWQKRYAEKTKGGSTPNTFGIPNHGNAIGFGSVPPPAIFIDVEALPQAPEGSDADRIARGLPPLGKDPEPSAEEIAERRRKLGLDAPPAGSDPR